MAGGERGEAQRAEVERLAEGHFEDAVVAAEAMLIEAGRGGRGEGELVAGDVVGVGVGDEGARLAAADVDRERGGGEEQAVVEVEHGGRDDEGQGRELGVGRYE